MIRSWANAATRRFAEDGKSRFSGLDEAKALLLLRIVFRFDDGHAHDVEIVDYH